MDANKSLQDQFAPHGICYGCGPANSKGLQIGDNITIKRREHFDGSLAIVHKKKEITLSHQVASRIFVEA